MATALVILAMAAVLVGDLRQVVTVVALVAFATIQLVVLPPAVDRALHVVMWAGLVAWLALALG